MFVGDGASEEYRLHRMRLRNRPLRDIDPFDAKGITETYDRTLYEVTCNNPRFTDLKARIVNHYARMGVHRYNLLQGKHYQFLRVEKYNVTTRFGPNIYYITSSAIDPANGAPRFFQTKIDEHTRFRARLDLTCYIARLRGDPKIYTKKCFDYDDSLPEWPPENPFKDTKRFYVVKKSELQDNVNDWIRLYLELAVSSKRNMFFKDEDLSNLEIVKVAIETTTTSQDPNEGHLNAMNTTVYISYRDPSEARVGKDVDRIAIVRRSFDKQSSCFSLVGHNQSSETISKALVAKDVDRASIVRRSFHEQSACSRLVGQNQSSDPIPKKGKSQSAYSQRLGVRKPWLLCIHKWRKAYQTRCVRMTRRIR
ncbi:UPF0725 protein At3g19520 isoform X2 [Arabidopsis lyrata subsp. lyrata]|uniref:UPF0725 protein At3g19520 isoform X2 n=1 Tax=Arabidopsis lyrata subsp. lyrata TaxID=81972 RepID=UPI000A29CC9B|nr:UPF0725 protein At3g19520 isoform X2 [Arabidopsis lyrata subsp. lyrata]|eukprot:XP_020866718.1 UPF0725 protein At3g19520 isoform X2 [Arabidopsis lyrata subsp. lyrata]